MSEAPDVRVHLIKNGEKPEGVGEPGVPVVALALANALARVRGKRFRDLPLRAEMHV